MLLQMCALEAGGLTKPQALHAACIYPKGPCTCMGFTWAFKGFLCTSFRGQIYTTKVHGSLDQTSRFSALGLRLNDFRGFWGTLGSPLRGFLALRTF